MELYKHSRLQQDSHIRLIKINSWPSAFASILDNARPLSLELIEVDLFHNDGFQALSYTWGDLTNRVPITIDNQTLTITPNLLDFLKRLREHGRRTRRASYYWADQICNQTDIPERNRQVALMASIYQKSSRTLVWLGEPGKDGAHDSALDLLRRIDIIGIGQDESLRSALPKAVKVVDFDVDSRTKPQLLDLMNMVWFTRAWIIQEVAVAKDYSVRIGGDVLRWESLDLAILALAAIEERERSTLTGSPILRTPAAATIRHIQYCKKRWIGRKALSSDGDFLQVLARLSPIMNWRMPSTMSRLVMDATSSFSASSPFQYHPSPLSVGRVLVVRGKIIDTLDVVLTDHEFPRGSADSSALIQSLDRPAILGLVQRLWRNIRIGYGMASIDPETLYRRAVKVLLCYDKWVDGPSEEWDRSLDVSLRMFGTQHSDQTTAGTTDTPTFPATLRSKMNRKSIRSVYISRNKRLFGLAPPLARTGDIVYVLYGSRTPIILRHSESPGRLHVMGQSYLEDWMHGNNISWTENEADSFELD
ncbi:heterokaryon incompatibility protein-domain-containing protein [Podospora australis]|uniref:Heterokaryon incompatibility protein-domain-containing protein n=1 Tax=Podospora australis TaxID=1536484 RepID=A0AAN6WK80_9PEZI|nr:heterokaryon incompatibility protein-domain-containing protein [Podospora australis]